MRTTQAELRAIFAQLTESAANHGVDTTKWELSRWAPGDGVARYRIESDGGATHPLGSSYRGAAEMSSAMRLAVQLLWQTPEEFTAREHVEHDGPHSPDCCVCPRGVRSHWAVCPAGARLTVGATCELLAVSKCACGVSLTANGTATRYQDALCSLHSDSVHRASVNA